MKYQKNNNNMLLNIKKIINFTVTHTSIAFGFFTAFFKFSYCLIAKIFFSDKDSNFNTILIIADTTEEYNI